MMGIRNSSLRRQADVSGRISVGARSLYAVILCALCAVCAAGVAWAASGGGKVVVYTSVDEVDAKQVLAAFEKEAGIEVLPLFDTEAAKTTGLALRLLSEKSRPRADVFWNNELSRTLMLADKGVLAPYQSSSAADIPAQWKDAGGMWAAYSLRARVIVCNADKVKESEAPKTLWDLCLPRWKNKAGIANPLFGTTACQAAALARVWGEAKALEFFRKLQGNGIRVYDGNSTVRDAVAAGEIEVGLTDTDDALIGVKRGMKIAMVLPDQEKGGIGTLVIPNSVALVAGAPHPKEAKAFIDFLLSRAVEKRFADPADGQIPVRGENIPSDLASIKAMKVDWAAVSELTGPFSKKAADILTGQAAK